MTMHVPGYVAVFNPIARRVLKTGALMGPNALITVRGRKSGVPRTTPVAIVEIDGRRWVIGTFGDTNWVRNLRAAGEATVSASRRRGEASGIRAARRLTLAIVRTITTSAGGPVRVSPDYLHTRRWRDACR